MKKFLTKTTDIIKGVLTIKKAINLTMNPISTARDIAKKFLINSSVYIIKKAIKISTNNKVKTDSNIVLRQLNALGDSEADMTNLEKSIKFDLTLDSFLEEANQVEEYILLKYVNLTKIKNKMGNFKNEMREDLYNYITENNFENLSTLSSGINEVINSPTEIIGCEFAKCNIEVKEHNQDEKNFSITFEVKFGLKSQNNKKRKITN